MKALVLIFFFSATSMAQIGGGGQTKANESGWTIDTLKAHFDELRADDKILADANSKHATELRDAADKRYNERFLAQESAQSSYKTSSNEFRGTLSDQATRFLSRAEAGAYILAFIGTMGVLVAWLGWGRRRSPPDNNAVRPGWVDDAIKELTRAMKQ